MRTRAHRPVGVTAAVLDDDDIGTLIAGLALLLIGFGVLDKLSRWLLTQATRLPGMSEEKESLDGLAGTVRTALLASAALVVARSTAHSAR